VGGRDYRLRVPDALRREALLRWAGTQRRRAR